MNVDYADVVKTVINKNGSFESNKHFQELEKMATQLLRSKDVDSCRSLDYSFYESEKDYRSRYSIGKNSYSTDFQERRNELFFEALSNFDIESDFNEVVNLCNISRNDLIGLIKNGVRQRNNDDFSPVIQQRLNELYLLMVEIIKSESKDLIPIFNLMSEGMNGSEIAQELGIHKSTASKKMSRVLKALQNKTSRD